MIGSRVEGYLGSVTIASSTIIIPVLFTPVHVGPRTATLVIDGDMDAGSLEIPLTGTGTVDAVAPTITDHADLAEARIMQQFKGAVKFKAEMRNIGTRTQPMEYALQKLFAFFNIDAMEGVALDVIGKIVGESRTGGATDAVYRAMIRARCAINSSQGTLPDIATICRIFLGDAGDLLVAEVYPAELDIYTEEPDNGFDQWTTLRDALEQAAPCGVSIGNIKPIVTGVFGFDEDDTALGFDAGGLVEDYE